MLRYHNWGKFLKKRGYNVTIYAASTVHNTNIDVIDELQNDKSVLDGITYIYAKLPQYRGNGIGRMWNMFGYCTSIKKMSKMIQAPDVIITCEAYVYRFARAVFKEIPIITDTVDLWPESIIEYANVSKKNLLIQLLYRIEKDAYLNSDALIFSMEGGKEYLLEQNYSGKIDLGKVFHINMGCDLELKDRELIGTHNSLGWDLNHKNIVYIGSIRQANNIQQICDAAKELTTRSRQDIDFQIYGNGDELEKLRQYIADKKIHNVNFYGRIDKKMIPFILSHSTANILTYKQVHLMKYGGSQSKLFDYLASGKPIICNAKFGYNLITRYNCGVVTEDQSSQAFADAVETICNMPEAVLKELGQNARKAAEAYDQPVLVEKLIDVFNYLENKKGFSR